nr:unnamed protein product [Callosobruchus chinensis]
MARIRWGADREILIRIYQALIESRLSYASIVYGSARRSKIKELERLQLAAVRAATGAFRTSPTVAVLCEASIMPLHLKIGQQTLMCFNCQSLGHGAVKCTKQKLCTCGQPPHDESPCQDPKKCVNCGGNHSSAYKACPQYKIEAAIQKVKVVEKIPYPEAKRKVTANIPTPNLSYAASVAKPVQDNTQAMIKALIPHIESSIMACLSKLIPIPTESFKAPIGINQSAFTSRERTDSVSTNPSMTSEKRKKQGASSTEEEASEGSAVLTATKKRRGRAKHTTQKNIVSDTT